MKKRTAWVLVAGVAAVAIGAAAVGALALFLRGSATGGSSSWSSSGNSYLYLNLNDEIPEQTNADLPTFFERRPPTLRTLVESLDRAAADPKVTSVVLRVGFLPEGGWGKVQELRDAVVRFRKSGKPVNAHLEFCGNKEYYLATAATRITAVPEAILDVTGIRTESMFFGGTLQKLGVEAQFEGVGKYKNAPNQFTETGFTEPHREQMEALTQSLYEQYVSAIAEGRKKSAQEVQAMIDGGPYDGHGALAAGLVDELAYQDQVDERLQGAGQISPAKYVKGGRGFGMRSKPRVALVYAVGQIVTGESVSGAFGEVAGSETVSAALREAREDDSIKAIILRVDSPGGSATASDVIWREVDLARQKKPVIVSMGDLAASGGYYIAMAADGIVAQPGTLTGSIGVFSGKFSLRGLYDKIGVSKEIIAKGEHAAIFTEYRPWTDEERQLMRTMMEGFYRTFVTKAAQGRKKSFDEIHAVAQGRVWTGVEAHRIGLVDRLGGLETALVMAKERAKIDAGEQVNLVVLPERKGFLETFLERQEDSADSEAVALLPRDLRALVQWSRTLADGAPLARLPFDVSFR